MDHLKIDSRLRRQQLVHQQEVAEQVDLAWDATCQAMDRVEGAVCKRGLTHPTGSHQSMLDVVARFFRLQRAEVAEHDGAATQSLRMR